MGIAQIYNSSMACMLVACNHAQQIHSVGLINPSWKKKKKQFQLFFFTSCSKRLPMVSQIHESHIWHGTWHNDLICFHHFLVVLSLVVGTHRIEAFFWQGANMIFPLSQGIYGETWLRHVNSLVLASQILYLSSHWIQSAINKHTHFTQPAPYMGKIATLPSKTPQTENAQGQEQGTTKTSGLWHGHRFQRPRKAGGQKCALDCAWAKNLQHREMAIWYQLNSICLRANQYTVYIHTYDCHVWYRHIPNWNAV